MTARYSKPVFLMGVEFSSKKHFARAFSSGAESKKRRILSRLDSGQSPSESILDSYITVCGNCQNPFFSHQKNTIYCSSKCKEEKKRNSVKRKLWQKKYEAINRSKLLDDTRKRQVIRRLKMGVEGYNEYIRAHRIKWRTNLKDGYIKHLLNRSGELNNIEIPAALIKLKRQQLKLKRLIKGDENEKFEN